MNNGYDSVTESAQLSVEYRCPNNPINCPMTFLHLLRVLATAPAIALTGSAFANETTRPFRVGMTPAFLHDQHSMLAEWKVYLEKQLGRPVIFIQRDSYRETMDLIIKGKLDFAWLCDYPYIALGKEVRLLAVASYQQQPLYRSYLIVPGRDTQTKSLLDLKGKVFAYADPNSNTGYVVPRHVLKKAGIDANSFSGKPFLPGRTARPYSLLPPLADGAAVDSYVWDSLQKVDPQLVARTRIVWTSEAFGFPLSWLTVPYQGQISRHSRMHWFRMRAMTRRVGHSSTNSIWTAFEAGAPSLYERVADMMRAPANSDAVQS